MQRLALLAVDHFRAPANRLYPGGSLNGSTWEARHQLASVIYLIHLPFVLFAVWLGGGLWWVARRLFGNEGGFLRPRSLLLLPRRRAHGGRAQ